MNVFDEIDYDLPADLKIKHYDCLILCSDKDRDSAEKLEKILQSQTCIKDLKSKYKLASAEVTTLSTCSNKTDYLDIENLMHNSNYVFMLVTRPFLEDHNFEYFYSLAINQSLQNSEEKHRTLIPLFKSDAEKSSLKMPIYLLSIDGIVLDNLVKNETFDQFDVSHISHLSFSSPLVQRIERMFSEKYHLRQDRNDKRNVLIKKYLDETSHHCQSKKLPTHADQSFIRNGQLSSAILNEFNIFQVKKNDDDFDEGTSNTNRSRCDDFGSDILENYKTKETLISDENMHNHKILKSKDMKSKPMLKVMPFRPSSDGGGDDDDGDQTHPKEIINVSASRLN